MTDAELINLIKNDDPRGMSTVYETFRSEFVHWIMRLQRCGNEDAREFYQASIIILYDNAKAGKLDALRSSLKTYLFGIGKNLVWQRYRTNHREQVVGAEFYIKIRIITTCTKMLTARRQKKSTWRLSATTTTSLASPATNCWAIITSDGKQWKK